MSQPETPLAGWPVALSIAGFDPSGGAGILADLRTFAAHRVYGMAAITALTVQSTLGVRRTEPLSPATLFETIDALFADEIPSGIKIGMVGSAENIKKIAPFFVHIPRSRIVLDPVLRSSSGLELLEPAGVELLKSELLPRVGWLTPNLAEAELLTGVPVRSREEMLSAAGRLQQMAGGAIHIVVKGGHLPDAPDDLLLTAAGEEHWLCGERIRAKATHGTGCTFASALLANLLLGAPALEAASAAKEFVRRSMLASFPVGRGKGPMHQLFRLDEPELR